MSSLVRITHRAMRDPHHVPESREAPCTPRGGIAGASAAAPAKTIGLHQVFRNASSHFDDTMSRPRVVRFLWTLLALTAAPAVVGAQPLSPDQAVSRAAEHSPSLRAALQDLRAARAARLGVEVARAPSLVAGLGGSYAESLGSTGEGTVSNRSMRIDGDLAVRYVTHAGTQLDLGLGTSVARRVANRDVSTTRSLALGPSWASDVSLSVRQPLLRGAGDVREAELAAAHASETAAVHRQAETAGALVGDVLDAYWELWYAERALEVEEAAFALVEQQHREAGLRAGTLGTLAPSEVLRFELEVASMGESLASARATRDLRAVELGQLLGLDPAAALSLAAAVSAPEGVDTPTLAEVIERARAGSSSLLALRKELDSSRHRLRLAFDASQSRVDLLGSVSLGTLFSADTPQFWQLPGDRPAFGAMVGLEVELPLGRSPGDAGLIESRARHEAAAARYEAELAATEARAASLVRQLAAAEDRVLLATRTADIAGRLADAERQRLELGTSTPLELLEAQQSHRQSELRLLRALVDRAMTAVALQQLTGTLVDRFARFLPNLGGSA